jgi:glycosyltransferase involved in cell wall biosynthesis
MNSCKPVLIGCKHQNIHLLFTIITPTYNQLDWLILCIASVRDQVVSNASNFSVEHIIQDAGTSGIEDLARELGAEFYRDGQLVFKTRDERRETSQQHPKPANEDQATYSLKIFSEKDVGMYDAINRGLARSKGEICAYLNSDEQYLLGTLDEVWKFFRENSITQILFGDVILVDSDIEIGSSSSLDDDSSLEDNSSLDDSSVKGLDLELELVFCIYSSSSTTFSSTIGFLLLFFILDGLVLLISEPPL